MNSEEAAGVFRFRLRSSRFLRRLIFACCCLGALALLGFLTMQIDRRTNGPSPTEEAIGIVLASGGLYHAHAESLDHRALVSARISNLKTTPDILIIADRKWQLVQQDLRWEKQVFGAYIDEFSPEDINSILKQLEDHEHLPQKIVLGISPHFLIHPPNGGPKGKIAQVDPDAGESGSGFLGVFSTFDNPPDPRPGLTPLDAQLDTLFPDGSNIWSTQRSKAMVRRDIKMTAMELADALIAHVDRSAFSQIVETGEAIAEAKSAGIEVVIALTPLHPEIYRQIHESPTTLKMNEGLEDLFSMARSLDVTTLGSFEPFAAGCKARDFASVAIPGPICLQRSLDAAILADATWPTR